MSTVRHELVNVRALMPIVEDVVDAEIVADDVEISAAARTVRSGERAPAASARRPPAAWARRVPVGPVSKVRRDAVAQGELDAHRRQLWRLVAFTAGGWVAVAVGAWLAWTWYRAWVIGFVVVLGLVTALLGSCVSSVRNPGRAGRCVGR